MSFVELEIRAVEEVGTQQLGLLWVSCDVVEFKED